MMFLRGMKYFLINCRSDTTQDSGSQRTFLCDDEGYFEVWVREWLLCSYCRLSPQTKPAKSAKPANPAKPGKPSNSANPAGKTRPAKPAKSAKPAKPANPATSAKPAKAAHPTKATITKKRRK